MKRKTFIYLTVAGAAALATPIAGCRHYSDNLLDALGTPDFLSQICDAKTIGDIGSAYRTSTPEESRRADLIDLLLKDVRRTREAPHSPQQIQDQVKDAARSPRQLQDQINDDPRLPQFIQHLVTRDFTTGNVVTIKGWVLSRTEARQCAIYSIIHQ